MSGSLLDSETPEPPTSPASGPGPSSVGSVAAGLDPVIEEAPPWFAIWTRSRAEKRVADQLETKRIEVFLPTVKRWSRWKDRKKQIDWPLFPGYCFARFDPRGSLTVLKCEGVAKVICFDGTPAPIPHSEIEAIQRLVETELRFDPCPLLHEGDLVEVTHGPLKGVTGRLVHKGPKTKLVLAVTMINRAVAVTFDAADVRKY
jgi:transcription antitermination factor NusG